MSLESVSTALIGVSLVELTIFATASTYKSIEFNYALPSLALLTFDVHERAELYFLWIMVLPMHARCAKDKVK